jgi:diguanylate cyclase (GGDEF)-like protein
MTNNDKTIFTRSVNDQATEVQSWVACLVVVKGAKAGDRILLNKDEITIGRTTNMDLCLEQNRVSRMHAVIQRVNEQQFILIDNNSTNGTLVNSKEIKKAVLEDQDIITIGDSGLKFIAGNSPEQSYYNELYRQIHMDKVLRIYNKHYFLTRLDEEIRGCRRYDHELSLILFDVDHFKRLNDTYGHLAGDKALVQLAGLIKNSIRDTDILCRYGGEEFTIIMPHTNSLQAYVVAEHTRALIAKTPVNHDSISISMTISLGITSYKSTSTQPCTKELMIAQADKALYQAKQSGRNKAVLSS